jgi:serine/threonine protein kinase
MIKRKLGQGAFGEIYLSFNEEDKKEYAVKLEMRKCKYP